MPTASATSEAAPRAEPALPARSRVAATTGAESIVDRVAISGFGPRSRTSYPPTLVCPNPAPCFFLPYTRRSIESTSTNINPAAPGNSGVRWANRTRNARAAACNCRT